MQLTLRPADTYAMISPLRPGQVKLGRSNIPTRRKSELHAAAPEIEVAETFAFFDADTAEKTAHRYFKNQRVEGEWYRVELKEVRAFYLKLQDAELPHIRKAEQALSFIKNHRNSVLCRSVNASPDELSLLFNRELTGTGLTISEAVRAAMTGANTLKIVTALQKVGILVQKTDGVALLDRTRGGALERFFDKTACASTWRNFFGSYAGFTSEGKCVKMSTWKKSTLSTQEIFDKVCAI